MPRKVNTRSETSTSVDKHNITAGEIFPDGAVLELAAGLPGSDKPQLLLWNGRGTTVGAQFTHGGRLYEPPNVPAGLGCAMRLPPAAASYFSVRRLFDGLTDLFSTQLGLSQPTAGLLAGFTMSTWLQDWLPAVLHLAMCGWDEDLGIDVLRLLHCVCRHPILVGEITPAWLRKNASHALAPTLLVNQTELRPNMQRLIWTSCQRGVYLPGSGGGLVQLYGPKAIFCPDGTVMDVVGREAIKVVLTRSETRPISLDERSRQKIADAFQPKLVMYRLRTVGSKKLAPHRIEVAQFASSMQPCASLLAQCFLEDGKLAREAMQLLVPQDEEARREFALRVDYAIVESLLGLLHAGNEPPAIQVEELTKLVNSLLQSRGERWAYSHEAIGRCLADMGIRRERNGSGQRVIFDRATSQLVHQVAHGFELAEKYIVADCPDCKRDSPARSTQIM